MNDPMTNGGEDPELRAFLAEAEVAKNETAALREELSRLRCAPEAAESVVVLRPGAERNATQAALARLLGSARRLRDRLASMDRRAPDPAAPVHDVLADVRALQRQASAQRRGDAARSYFTVAGGREPTVEQLDLLLAVVEAYAAMRAALLLSGAEAAAKEVVERGLVELLQLFWDMALLVAEAQDAGVDDIDRHIAAAEAQTWEARRLQSEAEARRRRVFQRLAGGIMALLLVALALAVAVALALALRGRGGKLMQLAGAR